MEQRPATPSPKSPLTTSTDSTPSKAHHGVDPAFPAIGFCEAAPIFHATMPRRRRQSRLATQAIQLGLAVPEVVARRLTRMALAASSPTAADREEFMRMHAEKVGAFYESWSAMVVAGCRANVQFFLSAPPWSAFWPTPDWWARQSALHHSMLDIVARGVAPIHRRALANAKRLRK